MAPGVPRLVDTSLQSLALFSYAFSPSMSSLLSLGKYLPLDLGSTWGCPGGLDGRKNCLQCRRPRFDPWVEKSPGEGNGNPLQYSCLENPMDRRACPWGCKELDRTEWLTFIYILGASLVAQMVKNLPATQETWVRSLGWEDPTAKGMAILSSILAWRIPWTEEPGGLQSMGLQRVGLQSMEITKSQRWVSD